MIETTPNAHIRWMNRRDLTDCEMLDMYVCERPATADDIRQLTGGRDNVGMVVTCQHGLVQGYVIYDCARQDRLDVFRLVFDELYFGQVLWNELLLRLRERRTHMLVRVNEYELAMQQFLRARWCRWVASERTNNGDVYVMRLDK